MNQIIAGGMAAKRHKEMLSGVFGNKRDVIRIRGNLPLQKTRSFLRMGVGSRVPRQVCLGFPFPLGEAGSACPQLTISLPGDNVENKRAPTTLVLSPESGGLRP